jgi:TolB-like protein
VLVALARAEGCVLSRDDLIARCWDDMVVGDDAINRVIGKIRRLAECRDAGFLIETVARVGYRLVRTRDSIPPDPRGEPTFQSDLPEPWPAPVPLHPETTLSKPRVAVLPFDGEGGPHAASLAEGATDCILSRLTRDSGLAVVGRPDSFRFRGKRKSDAARTLGATRIVDGAVSVCGDEVRITAYLIDGASGVMLWSEQFRGTLSDLFALQHFSAVEVTEALRRSQRGAVSPLGADVCAAQTGKVISMPPKPSLHPETWESSILAADTPAAATA